MTLPDRSAAGAYPSGYLAEHPLPSGIVGALGLGGYQLLADVAGVGRRPARAPGVPVDRARSGSIGSRSRARRSRCTTRRLKDDAEMFAFTQLAAQLAYLRLTGYRLTPGAPRAAKPDQRRQPGHRRSRGGDPREARRDVRGHERLAAAAGVRALPPAGPPPDLQNSELLYQVLLSLALQDADVSGAEAADLADRALELTRQNKELAPPAALEAAKRAEVAG